MNLFTCKEPLDTLLIPCLMTCSRTPSFCQVTVGVGVPSASQGMIMGSPLRMVSSVGPGRIDGGTVG